MRLRRRRLTALVLMAPVHHGHEEELIEAIAALPTGAESPFAHVGGTHFARITLIAALLGGNGEPAGPPRAYLLLTADFDGSLKEWSAATARREVAGPLDRVLGHCVGYPGSSDARAFNAFLSEHAMPAGFSIVSYRASVESIHASLELAACLRGLAAESQRLPASQLRSAWQARPG